MTTSLTHTSHDSGVPASARDFGIAERVVIVTGAAQGIGRELACQFAAAGAVAVVADLDIDRAHGVVKKIHDAGGLAHAVEVDVADESSVAAMVDAVVERWGRVDVLINNASIFATIEKGPFDEIPLDQWEQVLKVNVTGTYLCVRAVASHMRAAGFGRIVNISSDSVPRGVANYLHYVTSKSALIGMTNSLARELGGYGITVNCVRPGMVATEVERDQSSEARARAASQQCIPRTMVPTDLVGLMFFLATPAAAFITGQTIACDGGYTHSS
jgi:NAD(P)-dependent dehydrogenase (short-subunit alcohol dehydrogenase family)